MNNMKFIVWMLPVIFMIHDFEEIIFAEAWGKRYYERINKTWTNRQPFGLKYARQCQTPTFAIGVEVEFLLFTLISWLSVAFHSYYLWYGAMLAFITHLIFLHIPLCIQFKGYVPGIITTIIFIIPSLYYAWISATIIKLNALTFCLSFLGGIAIMLILLPVLHKLCGPWSTWISQYSKKASEQ